MTNDEMHEYDMVIMCAQAFKDQKALQMRPFGTTDLWVDNTLKLTDVVDAIMDSGRIFRVKQEAKKVRARMYWIKNSNKPRLAFDVHYKTVQFSPAFHEWAGDEQILTVPEV